MSGTTRSNPFQVGSIRFAAWNLGWTDRKIAEYFLVSSSWANKLRHTDRYPVLVWQSPIPFDPNDRDATLALIASWRG